MKLLVTASLLLSANIQAQTLPPACEQYYSAVEVCMKNAIDLYSKTDAKTARELGQHLAELKMQRKSLSKEIVGTGPDVLNERCTKPEFTQPMIRWVGDIVSALTLTQSLTPQCMGKFQDIR